MPTPFDRLFHASHGFRRDLRQALPADEADRLVSVALGRTPHPQRARALELLAEAEHPEAPGIMARVLAHRDEDPALRALAALRLADAGGREAEPALRDALLAPGDELVRARAAMALARSGTRASLEALGELEREEGSVARLARYAALLIAHRERIAGHEVARPAALLAPPGRGEPFLVAPSRGRELAMVSELPPGRRFGVDVARASGVYRIRCGPNRLVFALNAGVEPAMVREAPVLAGAVFLRAPEDGSYSVWRTVVAGPGREGYYVAVHRTDGTLMQYGEGTRPGDDSELELRSTDVVGNVAVGLVMRVNDQGLEFIRAESDIRLTGTRTPAPLRAPS